MNAKKLIAATVVTLAAGSSFAFDVTPLEGPNAVPSQAVNVAGKSRAEVNAELAEARANGTVVVPETARVPEAAPSRTARPMHTDLNQQNANGAFPYVLG
jgi:hypothetical protein